MAAKKRNLYSEFFTPRDRYRPYESEEEYRKDLLNGLRVYIGAWRLLHYGDPEDGFEPFSGEQAKSALDSAGLHIDARLIMSKGAADFRYYRLIRTLSLSPFEEFLLRLAYAVTDSPEFATAYAALIGGKNEGIPTIQLGVELYRIREEISPDEIAEVVEKKDLLFRYLMETEEKSGQPTAYGFRMSDRLYAYLSGSDEVAGKVRDLFHTDREVTERFPDSIRGELKVRVTGLLGQMFGMSASGDGRIGSFGSDGFDVSARNERGQVLQLYGPSGIGKSALVAEAAGELGFRIIFIDLKRLLQATTEELRYGLRLIGQECILTDGIPCFYGYEPDLLDEERELRRETPAGLPFLYEAMRTEYAVALWLSQEKADYLLAEGLHLRFVELPMLRATEREVLWREELSKLGMAAQGSSAGGQDPVADVLAEGVSVTAIANQYILTPRSLHEVVRDAAERASMRSVAAGATEADMAGQAAGDAGRITREDIREAVADQVKNQLGSMATHIKSIYTWDDLVIDDRGRRQLKNICDQVRFRSVVGEEWGFYKKTAYGRGICAMFYGQPGTGKTMAAQVIANELGMELYRIDISQMVSKYIGETQKNITRLFDRAKNTNAILFFDEADALFSKRSEVKDFHDKHANAETAHLLQKLEDYEGITILATNYANNIDDAFKRRIKFMVNFVFPEADVRRQLWRTILPASAPAEEELDLDYFADLFELSGSNIKEILTNAAFLAAAQGRGLTNGDIKDAVRDNFEKHGKILTEEDFQRIG